MSPGNIWDREGREGAVENKKKERLEKKSLPSFVLGLNKK